MDRSGVSLRFASKSAALHLVGFQELSSKLVNSLAICQVRWVDLHIRGAVFAARLGDLQQRRRRSSVMVSTVWRCDHAQDERTSSSCAFVRATSASDAPSWLKAAAMASPMPRPAPVITHLHDAHSLTQGT